MGSLDLILGGNGVNGGLEQSHDVIYFIVYKDYQGRRAWEGSGKSGRGRDPGTVVTQMVQSRRVVGLTQTRGWNHR